MKRAALPLPPASLTAYRRADSQDIDIEWKRRSRSSSDSWAPSNVPLDFAPETYRVTIRDGETTVRQTTVSAPVFTYTSAMQTGDFGGPEAGFSFSVQQISAVFGPGHAAGGEYHG